MTSRGPQLGHVDVVYILGAGRSGSTVFGDALALLDSSLHVGELRGVFDATTDPNGLMRCSCGQVYRHCEYWARTFTQLWGPEWPAVFAGLAIESLLPRSYLIAMARGRRYIRSFESRLSPALVRAMKEVRRLLDDVAASREPPAVVIDSSKSGAFAWLLSRQPNIKVICVHLVRDPRAVVHSWTTRAIPLPQAGSTRAMALGTRRVLDAIRYWVRANIGSWLVRLNGLPYTRLRYEDFVSDPTNAVAQVMAFAAAHAVVLRLPPEAHDALRRGEVPLGDRHLLGGNPGVKGQRGRAVLREDLGWVRGMPWARRLTLTVLFLPFLVWLGYPVWPRPRAPEERDRT